MPLMKRPRREQTHAGEQLRLFVGWPEQETYEMLRPIVLFGQASERQARVVGVSERTLDREADRFDAAGMASLFDDDQRSPGDRRVLSADIRRRWGFGDVEWHTVLRVRPYRERRPRVALGVQESLFAVTLDANMGRPEGRAV